VSFKDIGESKSYISRLDKMTAKKQTEKVWNLREVLVIWLGGLAIGVLIGWFL
jgi:hypothetical protein